MHKERHDHDLSQLKHELCDSMNCCASKAAVVETRQHQGGQEVTGCWVFREYSEGKKAEKRRNDNIYQFMLFKTDAV